jgi:hypothetical protein
MLEQIIKIMVPGQGNGSPPFLDRGRILEMSKGAATFEFQTAHGARGLFHVSQIIDRFVKEPAEVVWRRNSVARPGGAFSGTAKCIYAELFATRPNS